MQTNSEKSLECKPEPTKTGLLWVRKDVKRAQDSAPTKKIVRGCWACQADQDC